MRLPKHKPLVLFSNLVLSLPMKNAPLTANGYRGVLGGLSKAPVFNF